MFSLWQQCPSKCYDYFIYYYNIIYWLSFLDKDVFCISRIILINTNFEFHLHIKKKPYS